MIPLIVTSMQIIGNTALLKLFTIFAYLAHIVGMVTVNGFDLRISTEPIIP